MAADALVAVGCQSILPALEVVQMQKTLPYVSETNALAYLMIFMVEEMKCKMTFKQEGSG